MRAEVISIGDELTSGQRLDTNSQWLSQQLGELGIAVVYHTTVADDLQANIDVFRQATERVDVVVSTGGLGPTADDLTREALAAVASTPLVLDGASLAYIESLFASRSRAMPPQNRVQAMFPAGCKIIPNRGGTAPGIDLAVTNQRGMANRIFALPGVPAEMREMWRETVRSELALMNPGSVIRHRRIKCFGAGESDIEARLPDLIRRGRVPQVGITASGATITLRITAHGADETACQELIAPTETIIRQTLGELVFGVEDEELPDAVGRLLALQSRTLAVLELGTAGLLANWLSETAEAARQFRGGIVLSSLDLQPGDEESQFGDAIDRARRSFEADYLLAVGRLPEGASGDNTARIALSTAETTEWHAVAVAGHPSIHKPRTAKQALNLLRLHLLRSLA